MMESLKKKQDAELCTHYGSSSVKTTCVGRRQVENVQEWQNWGNGRAYAFKIRVLISDGS